MSEKNADPFHGVHLCRSDENVDEIERLAELNGGAGGIAGVLDNLNRQGIRTTVPGKLVEWGFRWNDADEQTERWWPQGITTSADATELEAPDEVEGRRLLVTSWYSKTVDGVNHGSRISVIDVDTLEYRHVLLVNPSFDGDDVRLDPLNVHAGGLVWCGPYLHVAGTRRGLFTCRMDDIVRVEDTSTTFGYRYVLPVRFSYDAAAAEGVEPVRYSFLSLDRSVSPPELVAGEYGVGEQTRRLVRYPLDPETLHLSAHEDGVARPADLDEGGRGHMQGATVVGGTWYVTTSRGRWKLGHLHVGKPGAFKVIPRALPVGPEDISYWPSARQLWSLTEYPRKRFVFCMNLP